jgi:hypothetical protein
MYVGGRAPASAGQNVLSSHEREGGREGERETEREREREREREKETEYNII